MGGCESCCGVDEDEESGRLLTENGGERSGEARRRAADAALRRAGAFAQRARPKPSVPSDSGAPNITGTGMRWEAG